MLQEQETCIILAGALVLSVLCVSMSVRGCIG
jgi:hypothetical protein